MRASALLGLPVYDVNGELVGRVHDLRLTRAGTRGCVGYRLTGFACGARYAAGHRLGYGDDDMAGPWPMNLLFRRWASRARVVDWADVTNLTPERIDIARRRRDLHPAVDGEGSAAS